MPSADLLLRLLEEKDLVSAEVLQAARREIQRSPLSTDAMHLSLWLVQGQHITAAQAERLLTAAEKAEVSEPKPPSRVGQLPIAPPPPPPPPPEPKAERANEQLELAPLSKAYPRDPARSKRAEPPVKPPEIPKPERRWGESPAGGQDKNKPAAAKPGSKPEPLPGTTKGPLDALIESEGLTANPFDDPLGMQLAPIVSRKFKLRRFLKRLFKFDESKVVRVKAADPRQVKLVLISWGVGIGIVVGLLALFWAISPRAAAEILRKAEDAAMAGNFAQEIALYDEFLKHYPKGTSAENVRLLKSLAEVRLAGQKAASTGDWAAAVEVATTRVQALPKDHLNDAGFTDKFGVALAKIGEGLAQQSRENPDADSVKGLQTVVDMLESDIPLYSRPTKMLEAIKDDLRRIRQEVDGKRELEQTVDTIRKSAEAKDLQVAYTAYRELVHQYPALSDAARLTDAMRLVSAIQQKAVKVDEQRLTAVHEDRPSGVLAAVPLAVQPVKGEVADGRGKLLFVVEQGTAFGLDAATGKILWRRFVALDPKFPPVTALPIAGPGGGDVVLCDRVHHELLRVQGTTGNLLWRLDVGQPIVAEPVAADKSLVLLTTDQRLLVVNLATGDSPRCVSLPQAVGLAPVFDAADGLVFLVAEQSNLIVLDMNQLDGAAESGVCRDVFHLGHEPGTIAAPPAVVGDFLLVPVNDASGEATLRVLTISKARSGELLRQVQSIRVGGDIDAAPLACGRGAAVVTAQGSLMAIDRSEAGTKLPFQVVAFLRVISKQKATHYLLAEGSTFWVADRLLTHYAVQADEQRFVVQATCDQVMKFVEQPTLEGGIMFQVMKRAGMPGVTAAAFNIKEKEPTWQTWLAAPLAAEPALGLKSGKLTVVTASGGFLRISPEDLKFSAKTWEPLTTIGTSGLSQPLCWLLPLPNENYAVCSGADTKSIVVYDPKQGGTQFRRLLSPDEMAALPAYCLGGLLTPCRNGQVFLLDTDAHGDIAAPLEPTIKGVNTWEWRTPLAIDDKLAVLCDGDRRLAIVGVSAGNEKTVTEIAAATVKKRLVSPLAHLGKLVFVVDSTNSLLSFELPKLTAGKSLALDSRCAWGPQRIGKLVLLATEQNRLIALNEQQHVVWQSPLNYGPLAGMPYLSGEEIFLSARGGMLWRISAVDGKELGKLDAGCPLGTGPVPVGSRMIVGGHDGTLLELKKP